MSGLNDTQKAARIAELEQFAKTFIAQNYQAKFPQTVEDTLSIAIDGTKVSLSSTHEVPTTWLDTFGILGPTVNIELESEKGCTSSRTGHGDGHNGLDGHHLYEPSQNSST